LKKLLMLAGLIVVLAPHSAFAHNGKHHRMRADEMAGIGIGAAALIGAAGYFLLRRRHAD
jgi:MYXO-CTERM domain-containing protein